MAEWRGGWRSRELGAGHCGAGSDSGLVALAVGPFLTCPLQVVGGRAGQSCGGSLGVVLKQSGTLTPTEGLVVTRGGLEGAAAQSRLC